MVPLVVNYFNINLITMKALFKSLFCNKADKYKFKNENQKLIQEVTDKFYGIDKKLNGKVMTMKKLKVIVLQGPPCSGKSTWANNYLQEKHNDNTIIVSRDIIRTGRSKYWIPSQERWVEDVEVSQVESALRLGFNVIIDDTNLNPKTIAKWEKIANDYSAKIVFKNFYIPFEEAVRRDNNPDRKHTVGKREIKKFYYLYYPQRLKEESRQTIRHKVYCPTINGRLKHCVICDIDGTLAWMNNRGAFEYEKVSEDNFDHRLAYLLKHFYKSGINIIFFSGREKVDGCEKDTIQWLTSVLGFSDFLLFMREKGDYRPDEVLKKELFEKNVHERYFPLCVFDDRNKVVNMWREDIGLLTCQVNEGNF